MRAHRGEGQTPAHWRHTHPRRWKTPARSRWSHPGSFISRNGRKIEHSFTKCPGSKILRARWLPKILVCFVAVLGRAFKTCSLVRHHWEIFQVLFLSLQLSRSGTTGARNRATRTSTSSRRFRSRTSTCSALTRTSSWTCGASVTTARRGVSRATRMTNYLRE